MGQQHTIKPTQVKRQLKKAGQFDEIQNWIESLSSSANTHAALSDSSSHLNTRELMLRNEALLEQIVTLTKANSDLEKSYSLLQASLGSVYDGLVMLDMKGNIRFSNAQFHQIFELNSKEHDFEHITDFLDYTQTIVVGNQRFSNSIFNALAFPETDINYEIRTHKGNWIEANSRAHFHKNEIVGIVWSFRDITALKLKEKEAEHRTYHDVLTGLPNRQSLLKRLRNSAKSLKQDEQTLVLFVDLDGFKDVNDSFGQGVGDALLAEVARRMEAQIPRNTVLTRHGGDEFVAIMNRQTNLDRAFKLSENLLSCFAAPFHVGHQEIYMSACVGISSSNDLNGEEVDRMITFANLAMSKTKEKGKNTFAVYDAAEAGQCEHRMRIRNEINVALQENQFELFFQPKICLESGTIKGAEALIRWKMSDGTYRSPIEFIPIAEESGQIVPIGQWVIKRCCEHLESWKDILDPEFVLALNISAKHFQKGLLQEDLASVLKEIKTIPSQLELEITETAVMDDIDLAVATLNELKELGIRTAIDDFGTGHSSLNYLRKLPIEALKIDKSFIDEILSSNEDRTLVKGIIDMVHALGIEVVAEGVENHQMAVLLQNMDCDLVQGYHYGRPQPEEDFIELIRENLCYI